VPWGRIFCGHGQHPENFRSAPTIAESASFADLPWWQVFQDERLQSLIQQALANNYDLRIAVSRVEQARQIAAQARAQFFPQANYDGGIARGKNSLFGTIVPNEGKTQSSTFIDLSVFWEVDLWAASGASMKPLAPNSWRRRKPSGE